MKFVTEPATFILAYELDNYINSEFAFFLERNFETACEVEANSDTYLVYTIKKGDEVEDVYCDYTNKVVAFLQLMVNAGTLPAGKIVIDCTW
jgi:hypothetical protein